MLREQLNKDYPKSPENSILNKYLTQTELRAFKKTIEELGESTECLNSPSNGMMEEEIPTKKFAASKPFGSKLHRLSPPSEALDPKQVWAISKPAQATLFDIVSDKKSGIPTLAEQEKTRTKRALATAKKARTQDKKRFEEDLPPVSLAEQLLLKKPNPFEIKTRRRIAPVFWSDEETRQFYRILQHIGMDFIVMEQFFPKRTRKQLLRKFHKEKKKNPAAIEVALQQHMKMKGDNPSAKNMLLNTSGEFKFSDSNSSSFDSTDQVDSFLTGRWLSGTSKLSLMNLHEITHENLMSSR